MIEGHQDRRTFVFEVAIRQGGAEEGVIDNMWTRISGIIASESQRLWNDGYSVDTVALIKGLRDRLNEVIKMEEER